MCLTNFRAVEDADSSVGLEIFQNKIEMPGDLGPHDSCFVSHQAGRVVFRSDEPIFIINIYCQRGLQLLSEVNGNLEAYVCIPKYQKFQIKNWNRINCRRIKGVEYIPSPFLRTFPDSHAPRAPHFLHAPLLSS